MRVLPSDKKSSVATTKTVAPTTSVASVAAQTAVKQSSAEKSTVNASQASPNASAQGLVSSLIATKIAKPKSAASEDSGSSSSNVITLPTFDL